MIQKRLMLGYCSSMVLALTIMGCSHLSNQNSGDVQSYSIPTVEASWIRDGKPIDLEGQQWYPVNDVEVLLDSEVYQVGEYKGVQVFVDKVDTKPYKRFYTKFAKNKFRYYEKRDHD